MNPQVFRNVVYPLYRVMKRDDVSRFASEFDRTQWLNRPEILNYQWEKTQRLIAHAYQTVPYYTELFNKIGIKPSNIQSPDDLKLIPPLTKEVLRNRLDDLISTTTCRQNLHKDSTGGSTGEPTWYYLDDNVKQARQTLVLRGNSWCGALIGDKQATLWGAAFDIKPHQQLKGKIRSYLVNTLFLSSYNLSNELMEEYAKTLQEFRPKLLTSYPTPLVILAEFLKSSPKLSVRPGAIITSSETLFDHQRKIIEETYNCSVFNRYGSREFGAIAHECDAHAGLHINADRLFVEFIKSDGSTADYGEAGEMLITDLDNYGMPFIRYKIDDLAVPSDRLCSCGRGLPMIEKVEGRVFDVIVTPTGTQFPGTFWTLISRAVPGITKFQIVQKEPSSIVFKIVPSPEFELKSLDKLESIISEHTNGSLKPIFEVVDNIPLTRSGKHRFIVSEIKGA